MDGGRHIQSRRFAAGVWTAAALLCACAVPAFARDGGQADVDIADSGLRTSIGGNEAEPELSPEDNAIIDRALALDLDSVVNTRVKPLRLPSLANVKTLDLARTDRPDGSGTVIVKKGLSTEWDANVGADLGLAATSPSKYGRDNPLGEIRNDRNTGAAWASLGVPNFASVDARIDPDSEQGRIGTTFRHTRPVGDNFAVSVSSRYSVTETLGETQAAPVPHVWGSENLAKLEILQTGTTLAVGLNATSTDPVTHNSLSAEQRIYGPLGLKTAVSDIGRADESRSVSAHLKLSW